MSAEPWIVVRCPLSQGDLIHMNHDLVTIRTGRARLAGVAITAIYCILIQL
jgi:hypothetical protein